MLTIDDLKSEKDVPVILVDHRGIIVYINACFEDTFQWREDDIIGKTLTKIIPGKLKDSHNMGFSRYLVTGIPTLLNQPLNLEILNREGKSIQAEHFIISEKIGDRRVFGATIRVKPRGAF